MPINTRQAWGCAGSTGTEHIGNEFDDLANLPPVLTLLIPASR
jgi:hypothetical protein